MINFDPTRSYNAFTQGAQIGRGIREGQTAKMVAPALASGNYQEAAKIYGKRGDAENAEAMHAQYEEQLKGMKAEEVAQAAQRAETLARVAYTLQRLPYENRRQALQEQAPALQQMRIDPEMLAQFDPTDQAIDGVLAQVMPLQEMLKPYTLRQGDVRMQGDKVLAENPREPQFGFQNVQGVGLVRTNPASGEAALAFELPENLRGAGADNVQSVQVLDTGEIALITRSGNVQKTGLQARNPYQITDVGGVPVAVNRQTAATTPLSTPGDIGATRAEIATITADEEARRKAREDLPQIMATADASLSTLRALRDHPALGERYGIQSGGGLIPPIPGTRAAEAQGFINQVLGQAFLQAFQSLKGGGHITEIEGTKATQAITRLGNQSMSKADAIKAIDEMIEVIEAGTERARQKAQGQRIRPQNLQDASDDDLFDIMTGAR